MKYVVLNSHALADEAVTRYLAAFPDAHVLLDLDEGADLCLVTDLAAVEIDEFRKPHVSPSLTSEAIQT